MMERRVYSLKFEEFECNSKDLLYPLQNFLVSLLWSCSMSMFEAPFVRFIPNDRNIGSHTMLGCPGFLDPGFLWKP